MSGSIGNYDETYWNKRSEITLNSAKTLLDLTKDIYVGTSLNYNKYSVNISTGGYNQIVVRNRAGNSVLIAMRYGSKQEEIKEILEEAGIPYSDKYNNFRFQVLAKKLPEYSEQIRRMAELNNRWWASE